MDYGRATWGNSETMARLFLQSPLSGWLERIEAAFRRTLINKDERDQFYVEFDTSALLQADTLARAQSYMQLITCHVMVPNEARRREGLPDMPGGDAFFSPNTTAATAPAPNSEASA
jgi:phage portal protein BeeE